MHYMAIGKRNFVSRNEPQRCNTFCYNTFKIFNQLFHGLSLLGLALARYSWRLVCSSCGGRWKAKVVVSVHLMSSSHTHTCPSMFRANSIENRCRAASAIWTWYICWYIFYVRVECNHTQNCPFPSDGRRLCLASDAAGAIAYTWSVLLCASFCACLCPSTWLCTYLPASRSSSAVEWRISLPKCQYKINSLLFSEPVCFSAQRSRSANKGKDRNCHCWTTFCQCCSKMVDWSGKIRAFQVIVRECLIL